IALQFIVTWASVRVRWIRHVVTGEPRMLLERGVMLSNALHDARVTESEVRAAVRSAGLGDLNAVEAVVLETDGSFSVIKSGGEVHNSSLKDVQRMHQD